MGRGGGFLFDSLIHTNGRRGGNALPYAPIPLMDRLNVLEIPQERRTELLENHHDTVEVEIGPETLQLYLGGCTFDYAEREGLDLGQILNAVEDAAPEDAPRVSFEQATWLVYLGALPFGEPPLEPAEIKLLLSFDNLEDIMTEILPRVEELAEANEGNAANAQATASGGKGKGLPEAVTS